MDVISYRPAFWLLIGIPLILVYARTLVDRRRVLKVSSFLLRCLGIVLLAAALCRPFAGRRTDEAHVVFLVDVSESVDLAAARKAVGQIRQSIAGLRRGDTWSLLDFGASARPTDPDALAKRLDSWTKGLADDRFRRESNIADALLTARLAFPADRAKRIVLFSDGCQTSPGLAEALAILREEQVDVRVRALAGIAQPEASVLSLVANTPLAYRGERVRLRARLSSNQDMNAELRLVNRGVLVTKLPVRLSRGEDNRVSVDVTMDTTGSSVWTAELVPEKDHFPLNNRASRTIDVRGPAKVLVLHEKPARMRAFVRAMSRQSIDVDVRGKRGVPDSLPTLLQFDAIVIANLSATDMTTRQMLSLKSYVRDFGGGLIMLGSENSFGLGGYYRTPVEDVLPIVSRYEKEKERPSLAMVLVIDKSGSMSGVPISLARQAAKASVELLSARDRVAVIAFDGRPYRVCDMTSATDVDGICAAIDRIGSGGGTNMHPAMALGKDILQAVAAKVRHMIVLSDGQSMPGDFLGLASEMSDQGITVSTVALGGGADRQLMKSIAETGGGRYYATMDPDTVPRIFTKETVEASRSAIREEPFLAVKAREIDFMEGIDFAQAPFLLGYVMTRAKPNVRMALLTEAGDPLLATEQYGLGVTMAFTSDASDLWAGQWLRWRGFGKFWSQALRACLRKNDTSGIVIRRQSGRNQMRYFLRYQDDGGRPLDGVRWQALVTDADGRRDTVPVRQVGCGLYEARVTHGNAPRRTVRFYDPENRKIKILHHHEDYPTEYRLNNRPPAVFTRAQRADLARPTADLGSVRAKRPISAHLLAAAICCLLGSILLRRI